MEEENKNDPSSELKEDVMGFFEEIGNDKSKTFHKSDCFKYKIERKQSIKAHKKFKIVVVGDK